MIEILGWIGSGIGALGAILLALNIRSSKYGFVCFMFSNAFLSAYAWLAHLRSLLLLYLILSIVSLVGIVRWAKPVRLRRFTGDLRFDIGGYKRFAFVTRRSVDIAAHLVD